MKEFNVYLRSHVTSVDVFIEAIPSRVSIGVKRNAFILTSGLLATELQQVISPEPNLMMLSPETGLGVMETVYESAENAMELAASVQVALGMPCDVEDIEMILGNSEVHAVLTKYRMLFEVDMDENGDEFNLSDLDDVSMEDIDYIIM